jgi:hypothetical protein
MNLPKFTADAALGKPTRIYRGRPQFGSFSHSGMPAVAVQPNQLDAAEGSEGLDQMEGSEGLDDAGGGDDGMLADEAEGGEDFGGDEGSEGGGEEEGLDDGEDAGGGDEGGEEQSEEG